MFLPWLVASPSSNRIKAAIFNTRENMFSKRKTNRKALTSGDFEWVEILEVFEYNGKSARVKMRIDNEVLTIMCYHEHHDYWLMNGIKLEVGATQKLHNLITGLNYDENGYASLVE